MFVLMIVRADDYLSAEVHTATQLQEIVDWLRWMPEPADEYEYLILQPRRQRVVAWMSSPDTPFAKEHDLWQ